MTTAARAQRVLCAADPSLAQAWAAVGTIATLSPAADPLSTCCRVVAGQQLSTKAASTIWQRVTDLTPISAKHLANAEIAVLRSAGLSTAKARSIIALGQAVLDKRLNFRTIAQLSAEDQDALLISIPGIGPWSCAMIRLSVFADPDVFSAGDAGLRRAMLRLDGLSQAPSDQWFTQRADQWRPFRSYACRVLWRWIDTVPINEPAARRPKT